MKKQFFSNEPTNDAGELAYWYSDEAHEPDSGWSSLDFELYLGPEYDQGRVHPQVNNIAGLLERSDKEGRKWLQFAKHRRDTWTGSEWVDFLEVLTRWDSGSSRTQILDLVDSGADVFDIVAASKIRQVWKNIPEFQRNMRRNWGVMISWQSALDLARRVPSLTEKPVIERYLWERWDEYSSSDLHQRQYPSFEAYVTSMAGMNGLQPDPRWYPAPQFRISGRMVA